MAARWGAGDGTLTASNMEFFSLDTLDETAVLSSGETMEVLQSCLDPSILSLFEDTPTIDTKGIDEESEATLLTALTEILDNVDDENLSPFDTLPDSELLSGHKGREHSPLRRLFCLSRSPPERDTLISARPPSIGKSLPRIQIESLQRSDGEEEDDGSLTLSPLGHGPDNNILDWEGLTLPLPVTFQQEGEDGISVSLGDLVRQMHPYCMAICMENEEGEQLLPEGGILLEVVDQGENGEPILAIPQMNVPVSLPCKEQSSENDQKLSNEEDVASDCSEHIVVDDEDIIVDESPVKFVPPLKLNLKAEMTIREQKDVVKEKSPSRRKKKKKCREQRQSKPLIGRVLRSGRVRNAVQEQPKKPAKTSVKEEKKERPPMTPPVSAKSSSTVKCRKPSARTTKIYTKPPKTQVQIATSMSSKRQIGPSNTSVEVSKPSSFPVAVRSHQPDEMPKQLAVAHEKLEDSSAAPSAVLPQVSSESPEAAPIAVVPAVSEPKTKSLSLAEYRQLRQQKKPNPVEHQDNLNSPKWPSLPELPKELPPIPCLPDPDFRKNNFQAAEEVRTAWHPRGPCVPPTPEALLVPPAYMVSSSRKVSAVAPATKPEVTPEPLTQSLPHKPAASAPNSMENVLTQNNTEVSCAPQSAGAPVALKNDTQLILSAERKLSPALSGADDDGRPQCQPVSPRSVEVTKNCSKTTTEPTSPTAAPSTTASMPQTTTFVLQKVCEVNTPYLTDGNITPVGMSSCATGVDEATQSLNSQGLNAKPVVLETKGKATTVATSQGTKSPTQCLVEAFTSEIGIEAADLTSLLEQFEETQAKEEHCKPEVCGRAAAVGNSRADFAPEKTVVEHVRVNDLSSTAALTPPATPPHQMWKPLAAVALLGKSKTIEAKKSSLSKVIQIEARHLPSVKSRSRPTAATVTPEVACMDHDYCLPNKGSGELGKRWNVKQQSFITIKPIKTTASTTKPPPAGPAIYVQSTTKMDVAAETHVFPLSVPLDHRTGGMERNSVLETPDASPAHQGTETAVQEGSPRKEPLERTYRQHAASRSPRSRSRERSREMSQKRSCRSTSPMSGGSETDSNSSRSQSRSPSKKRYRHSSSSSSSSRSSSRSSVSCSPPRRRRYSYSSSRSGSGSHSRSQSRSPQRQSQWSRSKRLYRSSYRSSCGQNAKTKMEKIKLCKEKAIEERRVVYVGRIRGTMTQKELRERFTYFGDVEDCTLHFRDQGDNYGFVTFYKTKDAFAAMENGNKLRKPDELPFDLCFGGRRQFCQTSYADLDACIENDPLPAKSKFHALDFDTLLKQAKQNLKR